MTAALAMLRPGTQPPPSPDLPGPALPHPRPARSQEDDRRAAFAAELRRWRGTAGLSQKALARLTSYTPSYVCKAESGTITASREFAEAADRVTGAGRALLACWQQMTGDTAPARRRRSGPAGDLAHLRRDAEHRRTVVQQMIGELCAELAWLDAVLSVPLPSAALADMTGHPGGHGSGHASGHQTGQDTEVYS
jgi:transcriptional regulator with XRE-family HTH domain